MIVGRVDRLGIVVSSLCAAHCALGAVLSTAAVAGGFLADERFELLFVGVAVLIAVIALGAGYREHRAAPPLWIGAGGLLLLASARLVHDLELAEVALSVAGAGTLVAAHVVNLRSLRRAKACA
ncbi:MAG: MerC domain-containing protein [Polyangiaceae bacterium]|nr:MerC domain-containing protein [Polyangiaceae bacterium]